jgi:hypothetical protein
MSPFKHHIKKQYKGYQIDVYHGMNGYWFAFIPNRVKFEYKTKNYSNREAAIKDCQGYIDRK